MAGTECIHTRADSPGYHVKAGSDIWFVRLWDAPARCPR